MRCIASNVNAGNISVATLPGSVATENRELVTSTNLSVRKIHKKLDGKASRGVVGEITQQTRLMSASPLRRVFARIFNLHACGIQCYPFSYNAIRIIGVHPSKPS